MNSIKLTLTVEIPTFAVTERDAREESETFLDSVEKILEPSDGEIQGEPQFTYEED